MPTPGPCHHDGVITYLEPDILEFEVKWALGSITMNKASGGDDIPAELLLMLKVDAVKVLHSICQQIWKTQQWPQDWKRSVLIPIPKKGNAKECSNYHTTAVIPYTSCFTSAGGPTGATPFSRSGGAAVRRYHSSKVRSSGCRLL